MSFDPKAYEWATMAAELLVDDLEISKAFYVDMLGFVCMYEREGFAYLDYHGAQIMICRRDGSWETGAMQKPFGRGLNLQITTADLDVLLNKVKDAHWPVYEGPYDRMRILGEGEGDFREFLVQDPDGYLLRFSQIIGYR